MNDSERLSRLLFLARESIEMWADTVERQTGKRDKHNRDLVSEIDSYRTRKGWGQHGFGGEPNIPVGIPAPDTAHPDYADNKSLRDWVDGITNYDHNSMNVPIATGGYWPLQEFEQRTLSREAIRGPGMEYWVAKDSQGRHIAGAVRHDPNRNRSVF